MRADFAHVGDRDGANGVYLINIIDPDRLRWAVAQYEHVGFSDLGAEAHAMSDLQAAKTFQASARVGFTIGLANARVAGV